MVNRVTGVQPLIVTVMNERKTIVELREKDPVVEVSQLILGLTSEEGQSVNVSCVIPTKEVFSVIYRWGRKCRIDKKS